ncbi:sialidase family protein [Legionella maioricensis]|uniref:Glycoside hydrolase n=1 Tax=Legionella maioricensis TaxID=2896528 RepID=A0A9X2D2V9_9GAMM|nr:sialidase family protein [Legionella maioricensis]MCL9684672.1 glycoside hydrolase [Legionella maioricensis]MCL9687700.1 glycoside hydrolase [Legionella maioricensis]
MRQHYKITLKFFLLFPLLTAATAQAAAPLWTLTPAPGSNPTQEVPQNSTATVDYVVQNQSRQSKNVVLLPTAGIQQTTPCRMAPNGQPGSSCTLNLLITSNALPQGGVRGGPVVCQANADGSPNLNQCYQPSKQEEQLKVSQTTTTQQATLTLTPTNLSFVAGTISSTITLTNTSTLVTATGLSLTPSTNLMLVNNACGNTLLPQDSCTFALTSSVVSTGNTVTAKGTNTPTAQLTASITPIPLRLAAVGYYNNGSRNIPLSYTSSDNGVTWSLSTILPPAQGGSDNYLQGISCDSADHCAAVGYYNNGIRYAPLSYTSSDNGTTWSLSTTLPPAQGIASNTLSGINCDSSGHCVTVGYYPSGGRYVPLSYTSSDHGVTWSLSTTLPPAQGSSTNFLYSVSCEGTGHCVAVGYYNNGSRNIPLSYTSSDHGVTWNLSTTLPPAQGSSSNYLPSVSCEGTGHCVAVGYYSLAAPPLSYTSSDHGVTWSLSTTLPPAPGSSSNNLQSVSCEGTGHCVAVGNYFNGSRYVPLSYTSSDHGVTWSLSTTLPPAQGSTSNFLSGVSCEGTGHCGAVGYYNNGSRPVPLTYTSSDHGATWSLSTTLPLPQGGNANFLFGVSGNGL